MPDRHWLITGAHGMLGHDLVAVLADQDVTAVGHAELDVADPDAVRAVIDRVRPDVVVNAAAYTAVDAAEREEAAAFRVNALGPAALARAVAGTRIRLVQVSTDYVFDGTATEPYAEDAPLAPLGAYGRTKAAGEWAVSAYAPENAYVVRTAWLYGAHGSCFPRTMVRLAAGHGTLDVVDDQTGSPTWTVDLARQIRALVESDAPAGTYHGTGAGSCTWYEFARAVFRHAGLDPDRISPTTTEAFPRPAPRPAYSVLGHRARDRAGLAPVRDWRDALDEAVRAGLLG